MSSETDARQSLSEILRQVSERAAPTVSVGELMERFGGRAIGALLLIFGLFCILPLPPGSTTLLGAPLVLLAPQLMFGGGVPWLPVKVREQTIATAALRRSLPRALRWLERAEALSRPRLLFLFSAWGQRVIGLICTILALLGFFLAGLSGGVLVLAANLIARGAVQVLETLSAA